MTERFNAPPGWPVPSGWSPPAGWEPDPAWPPAPAGWQFWVDNGRGAFADHETAPPSPTVSAARQASAGGGLLLILGIVGVVVLIALAGGIALFVHGRSSSGSTAGHVASDDQWTETSKTLLAPAPTVLPPGAVECGVSAAGTYRGAAKGTDSTSCPFVENVRDAFNDAGGRVPAVVDAYSPVTGKHYQMSCALEQVITCRGGVNAVVYVYEKGAPGGVPAVAAPVAPGPSANPPESVVILSDPDVDLYTPSGIRCQIYAGQWSPVSEAACSYMFPKAPPTFGPSSGAKVSETGKFEWMYGNMGELRPKIIIEAGRIYRLSGWTIVADGADTRFTNDATGKGMVVNADDAYPISR